MRILPPHEDFDELNMGQKLGDLWDTDLDTVFFDHVLTT